MRPQEPRPTQILIPPTPDERQQILIPRQHMDTVAEVMRPGDNEGQEEVLEVEVLHRFIGIEL